MSTDKAERTRSAKRSEVETWSRETSNNRPFCRKLAKKPIVRQLHNAGCCRLTWRAVKRHERQPRNAGCRYITLHNIESGQATRSATTQRGYHRATWSAVEQRARDRAARDTKARRRGKRSHRTASPRCFTARTLEHSLGTALQLWRDGETENRVLHEMSLRNKVQHLASSTA